ncbi:hypothetical protein P0Y43_19485 [Pseudomonas entomophila]|uniref:dermonecrotic toxin domain-containing protein n=1 Tax=Pseudomonas entomophila TaxID=312306 RepID=UPI0023D7C094|nr:DUF6543 domain-containing protein [Pseudomonas entomophila]MDF0732877.1 hypothetical protein [Pseudomonas entomophila]
MTTTQNPHQALLEQRLPVWARHIHPHHWQALSDALRPAQGFADAQAPWFANAAPGRREAVLTSQARLAHSQRALARALRGLKQIAEFAEPLLASALETRHGVKVSVRDAELLRVHPVFTWQAVVNHHERQSLLEAALHNFTEAMPFSRESALALSADIRVSKTQVTGKTTLGDSETLVDIALDSEAYDVKPLPLSPEAFASTCRALDIGQRYQAHLDASYAPAAVAELAVTVYEDRLRQDAQLAFLRHQLSGAALDEVLARLDGDSALPCTQLSLFGITLHEVLLFDLEHAGLLLHLPGHAAALQPCAGLAAVHDRLRDTLLSPEARQAFLAYVPRDRQATFLDRLRQNLDAAGDTPQGQTWPLREGADLHLREHTVEGPWARFLHFEHVARLKTEARQLAVPTADVDEQARKRRIAELESLGLNTLMLAGFFIPGVGALMLVVTACQLLDEAYEGYAAWRLGDRHQALNHLAAVGLNLGLIAGLHVAGKWAPKLLARWTESLDEVRLDNGQARLWKPDLAPYRSRLSLPEDAVADQQGIYTIDGHTYAHVDGQLHDIRLDARGQWRVRHPDDTEAYQPPLEHNGEGAWRGVHEQPLGWSYATLVRRLGSVGEGLEARELEQAARIAGVTEAHLRAVHLENARAPALLLDTLARMKAYKRLPAFDDEAFRLAYEGNAPADAGVERLCSEYPRFTAPLARRFLARLTEAQRGAWEADGGLPRGLRSDVEQAHGDLPLVRAVEGLHLVGLADQASERLAFVCLERLPGWPSDLRIDLRAASPEGPLLRQAGNPQAGSVRTVIRSRDGYEAYRGERPAPGVVDKDLCRALQQALTPNQQQALNLGTPRALAKRLQTRIDTLRPSLARRLFQPSPRPRRSTAGLRGGAPTDHTRISLLRDALTARYRRLYPSASDAHINEVFSRWRRELRSPGDMLREREQRLQWVQDHLRQWAGVSAARQRAMRPILNAWRRTSTLQLDEGRIIHTLALGDLDLVEADLEGLDLGQDLAHVQDINLSGNSELCALPPRFLAHFPTPQRLYLNYCRFSRLPNLQAPSLSWLSLQHNRITWDAWSQAALEQLTNVRVLELSDNPLIQAPDLRRLPVLYSIFMNNCSLTELPAGLDLLQEPLALDLGNNQFTRLPPGLRVSPQTGGAMCLDSPWLDEQVQQEILDYYARHQVDLLVADSEYEELLDDTTVEQRQIWQRLPLLYRRDLRSLLELDVFLDAPLQTWRRVWRALALIDRDPRLRARALAEPVAALLDIG